ncbi:MAG TPA: lipoprotein-releasing ABC transporter permease subunit [Woeseiaceae bacterium]|nr:lipoprotein-releasing ABC transporter permease subunit [Woeseiaceae bacterium]
MPSRFELWVGRRYVRSRSGNRFVSTISAISMLGIAIAVAVLIVVMSVVNGFERELRVRLLAMSADATIESPDGRLTGWGARLRQVVRDPEVTGAAPYVEGQALIWLRERLSGVELRGIDPEREHAVSGVANLMTAGSLEDLEPGGFGIVLGTELAEHLGARVGDKITVALAKGTVTPLGVLPTTKRFTVRGIYRVGMYEFDRRLAFINLGDAQRLYRKGDAVTGIRLAVADIYRAPATVREVALRFDEPVLVSDWTKVHVNFFRSIQITKSILFVILLMVVAVAAFNIVSTLVMVVKDKQSDIAILRTAGARPSSILGIFVTQGSIIGVLGTLVGLLAGVLLSSNLESVVGFMESTFGIKFLAADVYFISDLPADVRIADLVRICSIALLLALLAAVYPAWQGARTLPAEALRYD